ncbi:High mobility group B protein 1 [Sesamum angolense]|uniref:High mobility group B protein 1 n=1 Tax=Sesamum angolense TaxID=2727404 RepID=A0AAE1WM73_9LAMI|nr:High mobility group B protein 1 [Sesamum angolense]
MHAITSFTKKPANPGSTSLPFRSARFDHLSGPHWILECVTVTKTGYLCKAKTTGYRVICVLWLADMRTGSRSKGATKKETKEALKPVDDRKVGKRKAAPKVDKRQAKKDKKAKKDPNKPKRPPSAFFVFLEEFRKTFKKENPNVKAVSAVGKAGGEKWKSLTDAESSGDEAMKDLRSRHLKFMMMRRECTGFFTFGSYQCPLSQSMFSGSGFLSTFSNDFVEDFYEVAHQLIVYIFCLQEEVDEEEDDDDDDDDDDE